MTEKVTCYFNRNTTYEQKMRKVNYLLEACMEAEDCGRRRSWFQWSEESFLRSRTWHEYDQEVRKFVGLFPILVPEEGCNKMIPAD